MRQVENNQLPVSFFGGPADREVARQAAAAVRAASPIDWHWLGPDQVTMAAALGFAVALAPAEWQRNDSAAQQLLLDLGSPDFQTRENASKQLLALVEKVLRRGDYGQVLLIYDRIVHTVATTTDPEVRRRANQVYTYITSISALKLYMEPKVLAAAAAAGWVAYSIPVTIP